MRSSICILCSSEIGGGQFDIFVPFVSNFFIDHRAEPYHAMYLTHRKSSLLVAYLRSRMHMLRSHVKGSGDPAEKGVYKHHHPCTRKGMNT